MDIHKLLQQVDQIVEKIATGVSIYDTLDAIARMVEDHSETGAVCSILLADNKRNILQNGAAPSLPPAFIREINGLPIAAENGSCGSAAFYKKPVIVSDISTDPKWASYRDFALVYGLRACWSSPILDSSGVILGTFAIYYTQPRTASDEDLLLIRKISNLVSVAISRNRHEDDLINKRNYDHLTGLANRTMLQIFFEKMQPTSSTGLLLLDIDRFQVINSSLGYEVGDKILIEAAKRIVNGLSPTTTVYRYSSDEFVVMLENTTEEVIQQKAQLMIDRFAQPFIIDSQEIFVGVSIGISVRTEHDQSLQTLITQATFALKSAKEVNNTYKFYNTSLNDQQERRLELELYLRKALAKKELYLVYQPIISVASNQIAGLEALLRWNHPIHGIISPVEFIPILEETGLIIPFGEFVLYEACKYAKSLHDQGFNQLTISINISIRQFYQPNFVHTVAEIIKKTGISPSKVEIEITESITMELNRELTIINDLKEIGVTIAIDDFGTGYSSLSVLKKLPIDTLKIDQSFIRDITSENHRDQDMVKTIISMANNLKLNVIAEGVETMAQLDFLTYQLCEHVQGYYFSKPLKSDEATAFLESWVT